MKHYLLAGLCAAALGLAAPAWAGNIVLTGHDNDFHQSSDAKAATTAELSFVRGGSSLPVLVIDNASEAKTLVQSIVGAGSTVTKTVGSITAADFNHSVYSAFVVASIETCGGCDNPVGTGTTLSMFNTSIASFFNDGGGILAFAGATDPNAYAYIPEAASNAGGSPPAAGFVQTASGLALGIPAVNGDPTHNFFAEPGTSGLSSSYVVTERLGSATTGTPETIALSGGTIVCPPGTEAGGSGCVLVGGGGGGGTDVPEPISIAMLGAGLVGLGIARRRRR